MLKFRPDWRFALLAMLFLPVTIGAGFWQLDRAAFKQGRRDAVEQAQAAVPLTCAELATNGEPWRAAQVRGRYVADRQLLVDNRTYDGAAGYQVVTPLRCESGVVVLVDRGWVALAEQRRDRLPDLAVPPTIVSVYGTLVPRDAPAGSLVETPFGAPWPKRIPAWDYPLVAGLTGAAGSLWLVLQDGQPGALTTEFPGTNFKIEMHHGYAFQWFAISLGIVGWFLFTALHRRK